MTEPVPNTSPVVVWYGSYDRAVVDWLGQIRDHENRTVERIFSLPERAFSQYRLRLEKRSGRKLPEDEKNKALPLPLVSISRYLADFDGERFERGRVRYDSDPLTKDCNRSKFPFPFNLRYQIEFWTRQLRDMDWLLEQYTLMYDSSLFYLSVDHPKPFGNKIVPVHNEGVVDNSTLEPDAAQRTIRRTASIRVQGWLPRPVYQVKSIKEIKVLFRDWADTQTYFEVTEVP